MKIHFDNIDMRSTSGPNSFAKKLAHELIRQGHEITTVHPQVQLSFIMSAEKRAPTALRLDGIYFNTSQDWQRMNAPIKKSYDAAQLVVFQSVFNRNLTTRYFGAHPNSVVIPNGANLDLIKEVPANADSFLDPFDKIWLCASSWRPHKRLSENIRYFMEHAGGRDCLVVAGDGIDPADHASFAKDPRIFFTGKLNQIQLMGIMKRAKHFIHLALLDHCPNVVVDARAAGCHIICASSGGTHEIAGSGATVIQDIEWDWKPFELYNPPMLNFKNVVEIGKDSPVDMKVIAAQYANALSGIALL